MVNYPNMKKTTVHQTKLIDGKLNTRHRGMNLEEDLNLTNKYYLARKIANIHKKPTPIQIVKVDYPKGLQLELLKHILRLLQPPTIMGYIKVNIWILKQKKLKNRIFLLRILVFIKSNI